MIINVQVALMDNFCMKIILANYAINPAELAMEA